MDNNRKNKIKRSKLLLSLSSLLLLCILLSKKERDNKIHIIKEDNHSLIAEYEDKLIYLGDEEFLESIENQDCIKILDERREIDNPNLKIYNSYKIINPFSQEKIIKLLLEYEEKYPTIWNRTDDSMLCEWICHNIGYLFNYERDRTTDVDLNNEDELVYKIKSIK